MHISFAEQLTLHIKQSELPVRRIANQAEVPHQTLFNWLNGTQPRWHPALSMDIRRLADVLRLSDKEVEGLLYLAGCLPGRTLVQQIKEQDMNNAPKVPQGWLAAGNDPFQYVMGIDPIITYKGSVSVFVQARDEALDFGTMMQQFKADYYRGTRLRFAAAVRAADVAQTAGLWMRVDGPNQETLAFDNMHSRPITGTSDWTEYAVVLDIPETSAEIAFGILLSGAGQVWMAHVRMETVGDDVATTDHCVMPNHPVNLAFVE